MTHDREDLQMMYSKRESEHSEIPCTGASRRRELLEAQVQQIRQEWGEWTYDIPLGDGVSTRGTLSGPNTRLRRIVQIAQDLSPTPIAQCRVLDLGCIDGAYSIEFAQRGAETIGIDIREANIRKALFAKEVLSLKNLEFRQEDVRNLPLDTLGRFDIILCSGVLYHLRGHEAAKLVSHMFAMANRLVIIDTHIAAGFSTLLSVGGYDYWGEVAREHPENRTQEEKVKNVLMSWDNTTSFWFTRASLINLLERTGFSSVHECLAPVMRGKNGIELFDRGAFVAIKNQRYGLLTSPEVNELHDDWPEEYLSYALPSLRERIRRSRKVRSLIKWVRCR